MKCILPDIVLLNLSVSHEEKKNQKSHSAGPGVFFLNQIITRETYMKFWVLTEVLHLSC